ncbi:MAG: hypothetical protein JKY45_15135, partial [Emcibacter sp.]|nr:hypothetical protein [Emcibacter sp.]
QRAGRLPLSTYIKIILFPKDANSYRRKAGGVKIDQAEIAKLLAWLGQNQIAANLAVLANAAESGGFDMNEPVTRAVLKACADIDQIRTALMHALGKQTKMSDEDAFRAFDNAVKKWRRQRANGIRVSGDYT